MASERVPFWRHLLTVRGSLGLVAILGCLFAYHANRLQIDRALLEESRRSDCVNQLRHDVGVEILDYVHRKGSFPPGTISNDTIEPGRRLGWMAAIYPLAMFRVHDVQSSDNVYLIDSRRPWDDPAIREVAKVWAREMNCPSRTESGGTGPNYPASYIGIAGLGVDAPGLPKTDKRAGIFGDDRKVTPADVADGLSNTMIVAESFTPGGPWYAGGRATVRGLDPSTKPYIGRGRQFGGIHGEGANVLMADGSVRWVRPTASGRGFEAMSTIAGGEVVADPDDSP